VRCLIGVSTPQPAPSYPASASTDMVLAYVHKVARTSSRAAVRSWVEPGETSETHNGIPFGAVSAWMLPPKLRVFPLNQESISLPFTEVFVSDRRSVEMIVPSRIRCGTPSWAARSSASCNSGACSESRRNASSMYRYAVARERPKPAPSRSISTRSRK
jgi:hypothetical protein